MRRETCRRDRRPRTRTPVEPRRGGAPSGARPSRVRGLRGAARPRRSGWGSTRGAARCLPSASWPSGWSVSRATLREAMAALRAGRTGPDHAAAAAAAPWSRSSPTPPDPRSGAPYGVAAARSWLDALVFRRVVEPGACPARRQRRPVRRRRAGPWTAPTTRSPAASDAGRAPAGRLALPPHRSPRSPGRAAVIEAVTSVQADLHEMLTRDPGARGEHRALRPAAPPDRRRRSSRGDAARARRAMESHCDDTAALLRGLLG